MAGISKSLKSGQIVFQAGDAADGMYLVRKGELLVFLEKDGKEVELAKVPEGGMIGEMALFDRMPRSASVKAAVDCEITLISNDEFSKLMKQIPKWFVSLMTSLSTRLRTTNDRLKFGEQGTSGAAAPSNIPFGSFIRIASLLELLWHKDGTKEGKDWLLPVSVARDTIVGIFGESKAKLDTVVEILTQENAISTRQDQYKNDVLCLTNRGAIRQVVKGLKEFGTLNPSTRSLSESVTNMILVIQRSTVKSSYQSFVITLEELVDSAVQMNIPYQGWDKNLRLIGSLGAGIKLTKTSSKSGIGLKIDKEQVGQIIHLIGLISKINAAGLN